MIAEIQKIDRYKKSRTEAWYLRVYFKTQDHKWAQTDLVQGYRNFEFWRDLLKVGNVLGGLDMITSTKVNGDSRPHLVKAAPVPYEFPTQAELL
jgi:hypothetical protein